jgi:pSer/pThr/pTyr-binding forkhead associated (FHA) protein
MAGPTLSPSAAHEGLTERVDAIACLDESVRLRAAPPADLAPGRYLEVHGGERTLMIPLGDEPVRIGRGLGADLRLDETTISRRHAIVDPSGASARILDDRSSNGTFVNGARVQQAQLADGDTIVLGRVVLRYIER